MVTWGLVVYGTVLHNTVCTIYAPNINNYFRKIIDFLIQSTRRNKGGNVPVLVVLTNQEDPGGSFTE